MAPYCQMSGYIITLPFDTLPQWSYWCLYLSDLWKFQQPYFTLPRMYELLWIVMCHKNKVITIKSERFLTEMLYDLQCIRKWVLNWMKYLLSALCNKIMEWFLYYMNSPLKLYCGVTIPPETLSQYILENLTMNTFPKNARAYMSINCF